MPRITQEHKQLNRENIVRAATEGFKRRGVDATSIQDLMQAAGMTNGGFYNHFPSKEALVVEVYQQGFAESLCALTHIRDAHAGSAADGLHAMVDAYVNSDHRDHPEAGCPSDALPVDAGRHGEPPQAEYQRGLEGYLSTITDMLIDRAHQSGAGLAGTEAREQAIAMFSQMVGSLVVARAVAQASPALSDEVLAANRDRLKTAY